MKKMMNRTYIVFILLCAGALELFSSPVDMEKARTVAQNFMGKSRSTSKNVSNVVVEQFNRQNSIYVVNFSGGGWVMVAADDVAVLKFGVLINKIKNNE